MKKTIGLLIILLIIKSLFSIFVFPDLEGPDEAYHVGGIKDINKRFSLYYIFMNSIYEAIDVFDINIDLSTKTNPDFDYGSNELIYRPKMDRSYILTLLKVIQFAILLVAIGLIIYFILRSKKLEKEEKENLIFLVLIYFSWPQVNYSLTILSSDFLINLFNIVFFILVYFYRKIAFQFLIIPFIIMLIDWNPITNLCFLFVFIVNTVIYNKMLSKSKNKKALMIFLDIIAIVSFFVIIQTGIIGKINPWIQANIEYGYTLGYEPVKSLAVFFLSIFYMGGSMSFQAYIFEYFIFFIFMIKVIWGILKNNSNTDNKLYIYIISFFFAFNGVIIVLPMFDQSKYYYFLVPALILGIQKYVFKKDTITAASASKWGLVLFALSMSHMLMPAMKGAGL